MRLFHFHILWSLLLLVACTPALAPARSARVREFVYPADCRARRPFDSSVWVDPAIESAFGVDVTEGLISSWGLVRSNKDSASSHVLYDQSAFISYTDIPYEQSSPIVAHIGGAHFFEPVVFSHELGHIVSRSECHFGDGVYGKTIGSYTDPYPNPKEVGMRSLPVEIIKIVRQGY